MNTGVIDRDKKSVVILGKESDKEELEKRTIFLGRLGYKVRFAVYEPEVELEDGSKDVNIELVRFLVDEHGKDGDTLYNYSRGLGRYFDFLNVGRVAHFKDFIDACPMRAIYAGDVTKAEIDRYVEEEETGPFYDLGKSLFSNVYFNTIMANNNANGTHECKWTKEE